MRAGGLHMEAPKATRLVGERGFEPPNAGIKIRCLTAWRRPNPLGPGPYWQGFGLSNEQFRHRSMTL